MKKMNTSTKNMTKYAGKWVAIDTQHNTIIAAGKTLQDISSFVTAKTGDKHKIAAAAYKVPRKDEGPYILIFS